MRKHRRRTDWIDAAAKCPFYYECGDGELQCEGFEHGMTVTLSFRGGKPQRKDFMSRRCCSFAYERCPIYMSTAIMQYNEARP